MSKDEYDTYITITRKQYDDLVAAAAPKSHAPGEEHLDLTKCGPECILELQAAVIEAEMRANDAVSEAFTLRSYLADIEAVVRQYEQRFSQGVTVLEIDTDAFNAFEARLEEPPRDLPNLRAAIDRSANVFDQGDDRDA